MFRRLEDRSRVAKRHDRRPKFFSAIALTATAIY